MKIIIAPDKFKGSLTSIEVCTAIEKGLQHSVELDIEYFPIADGGDGFAEVMKYYTNMTTQPVHSVDALGRPINSSYELNIKERIAIIELAWCSGLAMLGEQERDPMIASTYGTGLRIQHAIKNGAIRKSSAGSVGVLPMMLAPGFSAHWISFSR